MQQAVQINKPCQRAHLRGQEEVVAVCLSEKCPIRLSCVNCQREGHHKDHLADLCHFDFLPVQLEEEMTTYNNAGIMAAINQRKQEFKIAKESVVKALDLLEQDFQNELQRVSEVHLIVSQAIEMVDKKNFLQFKEVQAQALVSLKNNSLTNKLKQLVVKPIIQDLQNLSNELLSKLQSTKKDQILKKHFQDAQLIEFFYQNRLNYDQDIPQEAKLIIEERFQELNVEDQFYLGGFQRDSKHGRGILFKRGLQQIWEGVWEEDQMKWGLLLGTLNLIQKNFVYIGSFTNDKKEGKGIEKYSNSASYEGEWKNDNMEGKGIYKYSNGESYEGEYKNGNKEGKGIYKYSNGESYEGEWKNGKKEGKGIYKYSNGESYEGEWKNGKKEGKGIYKYSNGGSYEGEFKNDKKEGKGIEKYSNSASYEGEFKNDKREGKGIKKYSNGESYEGEWKNDNKEGKGIFKYSNGDSSEGPYQNGVTVGEHQVYKPNSKQPYKITFYGANGQVKEVKMLV